jgi:hypothetical protein
LDCVHFLQREKVRTVSAKIKFLFSARGIRFLFWGEQAAADRAISTLTRLLQTPYGGWVEPFAITAALLRLDPHWGPLRGDPAFQKVCEEKQQ